MHDREMRRPEYDDETHDDDTHGCPGLLAHWGRLEDYVDYLESKIKQLQERTREEIAGDVTEHGCLAIIGDDDK